MKFSLLVAINALLLTVSAVSHYAPYDDFFDQPSYELVFSDTPVLESSDLLSSKDVFTASNGFKFICPERNITPAIKPPRSDSRNDGEIVASAIKLLSPLKGRCLKLVHGWWSYDFCHLDKVIQSHKHDPSSPPLNYILGKYDPRDPGPRLVVRSGRRILSHRYKHGTHCNAIDSPRVVEVQYQCGAKAELFHVKEITVCKYVAAVHSPRLCADSAFTSDYSAPPIPIECQPIVSSELFELWKAGNWTPSTDQRLATLYESPTIPTPQVSPSTKPVESESKYPKALLEVARSLLKSYGSNSEPDLFIISKDSKVVVGAPNDAGDDHPIRESDEHDEEELEPESGIQFFHRIEL